MPRGEFDAMPGSGRSLPERLNRNSPALVVGTVEKTYVLNGRVYVDVQDLNGGKWHRKVPLMAFGGGPDRMAFFPVEETPSTDDGLEGLAPQGGSGKREYDREVILVTRGSGKPYAIGMAAHPEFTIQEDIEEDPGASDHGGQISKNDIAFKNNGASFIMDANGSVNITAGKDGKRHRIQLPDTGGRLRISRGGEADEKLLLAGQVKDYLEDLEETVELLLDRLDFLEEQWDFLQSRFFIGVPVIPNPNYPQDQGSPTIVKLHLDAASLVARQTARATDPLAKKYQDADDRLVSSTVEISKKNVKDDT